MAELTDALTIGGKSVYNRVVLQPMEGCDCNEDGSPSELTEAKYLTAAASGAGIIWCEATAVCPEGRTNRRQMFLTDENIGSFRMLVEKMRETAGKETGTEPLILLQLTHSGRQSITPMIAYRNPVYEERRPMSDDNIVSDEYLDTIPEMYAESAVFAEKAGFDGVDVKSCHGYLSQELLSAYDRPGRYGGSFENRSRLYLDCVKAVKAAVTKDFLLAARFGVSDMVPKPYGFGTTESGELDLAESDTIIGELQNNGVSLLNVTVGNPYYNPHINRPFRKGAYIPSEKPETGTERFEIIERYIKEKYPCMPLVASGLSYHRADLMEYSEKLLQKGFCDFVGYGRMWLAYPMFWRDWQSGKFETKKCCAACSRCTELMRAGYVSGCAVFNEYYKCLYREKISCQKQR